MSVHNSSTEIDFDRAVEVGSQHLNVPLPQPLQHLGVRMSEEVPPPARDDRDVRKDGIEECRSGGTAAAVIRDLEDVRAEVALGEPRLGFVLDVAGHQDARSFHLHAQHDRRVVLG